MSMMEPNGDAAPSAARQVPIAPATRQSTSVGHRAAGTRLASDESWIEVASQPSSSSLSSSAADDIITTGLRVTQSMNARRRRRLHRSTMGDQIPETISSQEEYDESEDGESDQIMSSSNEDTRAGFRRIDAAGRDGHFRVLPSSTSSDTRSMTSDDDENATALGVPDTNQVFTPQPNAFTHPPSMRATPNRAEHGSYFTSNHNSAQSSRPSTTTPSTSQSAQRPSYARAPATRRSHTPYNMISPNHSVPIDHDAALRASLSTLLSCAAAARGLPKRDAGQSSAPPPLPARTTASTRIDQGTLRLVPESSLDTSSPAPPLPRRPVQRADSGDSGTANKRKSKSPSQDRRKKRRSGLQTNEEDLRAISPTLMTWVVGAGVVVLFSAISFSAGYALGKEVGRVEAMNGAGGLGCGPEAGVGLEKGLRGRGWRWGNASGIRA